MESRKLELLKQMAAGIAAQFGSKCEVVIHEVSPNRMDQSIVHIENGHVSGRRVGDGASNVVMVLPVSCWSSWRIRSVSRRIICAT